MSSGGQPGLLYNEFMQADSLQKEKLFALSCFDISHWEESPNWTIDDDTVESFLDMCEDLLDTGTYYSFYRGNEEWIEKALHRGILSNYILSWYLSSSLGYETKIEKLRGGLDNFDLRLIKNDLPYCDIELKRMATANSIDTEVGSHIESCEASSSADYTVLFLYFPLGEQEDSHRVNDYLKGYIYSYSNNIQFFDSDNNYFCPITAPIEPIRTDITPLERSVQILRNEVGVERRT
jgi:hypothetical protein